jgi:chorismate-pyruvate lyase
MLSNSTRSLVHELVELKSSTTLFLESIRGARLQVALELQEEVQMQTQWFIKRVIKLFFDSAEIPLLYCESLLNKSMLTSGEYVSLAEGLMPIGIVFHHHNHPGMIRKINIQVKEEVNPKLAHLLNVNSELIFKKRYDYWVGDREIGHICEFFNEESLRRS